MEDDIVRQAEQKKFKPLKPLGLTREQQEIIEYARKKKAIILGSLAQKYSIQYSRTPEDVDIRYKDKEAFARTASKYLNKRLGQAGRFVPEKSYTATRIKDTRTGKYVADVVQVPIKRRDYTRTNGLRIATPSYILRGKLAQLKNQKRPKMKVYRDISDVTGTPIKKSQLTQTKQDDMVRPKRGFFTKGEI